MHPQLFPKSRLFLAPILFCSGESLITQIIHPQEHELIPSFAESSFLCRSVRGSTGARACPAARGPQEGWTWCHIRCFHPLCPIPLGLSLLPRAEHQEKGPQVPRSAPAQAETLRAWLRRPQEPSTDLNTRGKQGSSHRPQCSPKTTRGAACAACPGRANTILKDATEISAKKAAESLVASW